MPIVGRDEAVKPLSIAQGKPLVAARRALFLEGNAFRMDRTAP
jgi:hypothetical protein